MKQEFIPYTEALAMKELGFDEMCMGTYIFGARNKPIFGFERSDNKLFTSSRHAAAPLYQQAFHWFRKEHGLYSWIETNWQNGKRLGFDAVIENDYGSTRRKKFETYEEARLACLKKLIQADLSNTTP